MLDNHKLVDELLLFLPNNNFSKIKNELFDKKHLSDFENFMEL